MGKEASRVTTSTFGFKKINNSFLITINLYFTIINFYRRDEKKLFFRDDFFDKIIKLFLIDHVPYNVFLVAQQFFSCYVVAGH